MRTPQMQAPGAATLAALAALVMAAGALIGGCGVGPFVSGSGTLVQTRPDVETFDSLVVGSSFDVTLRTGSPPSLVLRTDDNLLDHVEVTTDDDTLTIALDRSVADATLEADLTVPADALSSIELLGASSLTATEPITAPDLMLRAGGASRAFVLIQSGSAHVTADGASVVNAGGATTSLIADARGASSLRLGELMSTSAEVTAAGASRVEVSVSGDLAVRASGASTVRYRGEPASVQPDVTGASSVEPA